MEEKNKFKDDTFLARWLQGQLSEEEKTAFESSETYQQYHQIIQTTDELEPPAYDLDKAYHQLKSKRSLKKKRSWPAYAAIAASVALIFTAFWYFWPVPDVQVITQIGEQESYILPDNSTVAINAASELSFNPKRWAQRKEVHLQGEAFFTVTEGQQFTVKTSNGEVRVLGTEFNVWARDQQIEVICYGGLVEVSRSGQNLNLSEGISAKWQNDQWQTDTLRAAISNPSWTRGTVSFTAAPLVRVLEELKRHYSIKVTLIGDARRSYTGGFTINNLEAALINICEPMDLNYQLINQGEVLLREQ